MGGDCSGETSQQQAVEDEAAMRLALTPALYRERERGNGTRRLSELARGKRGYKPARERATSTNVSKVDEMP